MFLNDLTADQRNNLERNIAENLKGAAPFLQVSETTSLEQSQGALLQD